MVFNWKKAYLPATEQIIYVLNYNNNGSQRAVADYCYIRHKVSDVSIESYYGTAGGGKETM